MAAAVAAASFFVVEETAFNSIQLSLIILKEDLPLFFLSFFFSSISQQMFIVILVTVYAALAYAAYPILSPCHKFLFEGHRAVRSEIQVTAANRMVVIVMAASLLDVASNSFTCFDVAIHNNAGCILQS